MNFIITEFKVYLTKDKNNYITLVRTGYSELRDDDGKYLGDEFIIKILEKDISFEFFIPQNETSFIIPIGGEIYGFKINYDI